MKALLLVLIALLSTACGALDTLDPEIDPALAPYGAQILSWTGEKGWPSSMAEVKIVDSIGSDGIAMGVCTRPQSGVFAPHTRKIHILREAWNNISDTNRFYLLAHEMCHCLYNAGHSDDESSLMAPSQFYGAEIMPMGEITKQFQACKANLGK